MYVAEMTTFQISNAMKANRDAGLLNIAVVPVGSIEQHGPLLPLNTDSVVVEAVAKEIDVREGNKLFVYPCFQYTNAESGMDFAGGMSASHNSVRDLLTAICQSLIRQKYDGILFLDGHSPNRNALLEVSFEAVSRSFRSGSPFPIIVIGIDQFNSIIEKKFNIEIGRHGDWFEAFLFRQSGGVLRGGDRNQIDPFPSKVPVIPGIVGIPIQYRSTCGVIGKIGDGDDIADRGAEVWQYYLQNIYQTFKNSISEFCVHFRPADYA